MDFNIEKDGSLTKTFMDGGKFAFGKQTDLRAFYIELGSTLTQKGWTDETWNEDPKFFSNVGGKAEMLKGELTNTKEFKRNKNMFENKFAWFDKGNGTFDVEFVWLARKNTSMFGNEACVKFELNLSNRNMKNVEILEGNNKKVLQDGGWEFRNKMEYKNVHLRNKFKKLQYITKYIPFFSEDYLKEVMIKIWYKKDVEHDIALAKMKMYNTINDIIRKHFTQ